MTTGATADTVSLNLAIESGTGLASIAEGNLSQAIGNFSHAEGDNTVASGKRSHAEGFQTTASGQSSHAEGANTITNNYVEHASGRFNVSSSASTSFGNSGNTLFSVGNGTSDNARHNAFEIRQNGDIYISSGGTDIKLQDNLGGGGGGGNPTVELTQAEYDALVTAGTVSADTYYIITDAQAGDLTQYWTSAQTNSAITQAVSGKVDTTAITTAITSSSTDAQVPSAKAVYDQIGNIETLLSQI